MKSTELPNSETEHERFKGYQQTALLCDPTNLSPVQWWTYDLPQNITPPPTPSPHHFVFGKKMEWYFRHEISHSLRFGLLVENLQVQYKGITLGELDFILHDREMDFLIHVEMAFKFYLYDPSLSPEIACWVGPNRRDTLEKKLHKLQNRQFPLMHQPETKKVLKAFQLPELPIKQELYFKAQLFLPLDFDQPLPLVSPAAVSGFWIPLDRFGDFANDEFHIPEKRNWTINPAVWTHWQSFEETRMQLKSLAASQVSPLVWMKTDNSDYRKMFVVWW